MSTLACNVVLLLFAVGRGVVVADEPSAGHEPTAAGSAAGEGVCRATPSRTTDNRPLGPEPASRRAVRCSAGQAASGGVGEASGDAGRIDEFDGNEICAHPRRRVHDKAT